MAAAESQFHVLAVDDSIIDRTLIERLLKTSSYQGNLIKIIIIILLILLSYVNVIIWLNFVFLMAVTTVDSGSKALEFLGLCENNETNPNTPCVSPSNHQV